MTSLALRFPSKFNNILPIDFIKSSILAQVTVISEKSQMYELLVIGSSTLSFSIKINLYFSIQTKEFG